MGEAAENTTPSLMKQRLREVWEYAAHPREAVPTNSALLSHIEETIQEKLAAEYGKVEADFDGACRSKGIYKALDQVRELSAKGVAQNSEVEGDGGPAAMASAARIQILKEKREALKKIATQTGERAGQLQMEVSGRQQELDKALADLNSKLSGFQDGMDLDN
ncbi:hypothetical protein BSKO_07535 [Bryopsis sp. KO-2023]|nr:hypothetical protein BSKO_07535 [Bryopsis sp. KO-2023]